MKSTKKSFIMSLLSLMLCFAMLIGTTYAWFTDSVTSGKNRIQAGNLDVEMYHWNEKNGSASAPINVSAATDLFKLDYWEPGVVVYENFKVANEGTLALRYDFSLSPYDYNTVTRDGVEYALSDVLKVIILDGETFSGTRADAIAKFTASGASVQTIADFKDSGWLMPKGKTSGDVKDNKTFAVIVYWEPSDSDNLYNVNNGASVNTSVKGVTKAEANNALFIDLGINLIAAQKTQEKDSFDEKYDAGSSWPVIDSASVTLPVSDHKAEATLLVAPQEGASTKVTLTELSDDITTIKLDEKSYDILAAAEKANFEVSAGKAAAATIDLTLYVNDQTAAKADGFKAKVETYVAKGMKDVTIKYNGDASKAFGASGTATKKPSEAEVTAVGDYFYDSVTGLFVFLTDHFSEYTVDTSSQAYIEYFGNKAQEVKRAYDTVKDAITAIESAANGGTITLKNTGIRLINDGSYKAEKEIIFNVNKNGYKFTIDDDNKYDVTNKQEQYTITIRPDYECKIGETKFLKLADALNDTTLTGDIVLLHDISYKKSSPVYRIDAETPRQNIVIDLNGYSINNTKGNAYGVIVVENKEVTIKDSSANKTGNIPYLQVDNYSTGTKLTLDGLKLTTGTDVTAFIDVAKNTTVDIKNCDITVPAGSTFMTSSQSGAENIVVNLISGKVTVNSGANAFVTKVGSVYSSWTVNKDSGFTWTCDGTLCDNGGFSITEK